jgi:hypothetical protein
MSVEGSSMDWRDAAEEVRREIAAAQEALEAVRTTVEENPVEADVDAADELVARAKLLQRAMLRLDEAKEEG